MLSPGVLSVDDSAAPPLVLVLGGQRSGKSRWAEQHALRTGLTPIYIATAEAHDGEMAERIARHQERRDASWRLIEAPLDLADALRSSACASHVVLVDCLTLWLANLMGAERDLDAAVAELETALAGCTGPVVMVSNEVGSGIVPMNAMAREFVDASGRLHQRLAARASEVVLVTAGLAQRLK